MKKFLILSLILITMAGSAYAKTIKVTVNGMVCAFCVTGIEKTFKKQPAVSDIKVDLDNKLVTVTTSDKKDLDDATIKKLITDAGYTVTDIKREK